MRSDETALSPGRRTRSIGRRGAPTRMHRAAGRSDVLLPRGRTPSSTWKTRTIGSSDVVHPMARIDAYVGPMLALHVEEHLLPLGRPARSVGRRCAPGGGHRYPPTSHARLPRARPGSSTPIPHVVGSVDVLRPCGISAVLVARHA